MLNALGNALLGPSGSPLQALDGAVQAVGNAVGGAAGGPLGGAAGALGGAAGGAAGAAAQGVTSALGLINTAQGLLGTLLKL